MRKSFAIGKKQLRHGRKSRIHRPAAAVVELAVCLPVLVVLVLGAIESTSMTFLQNSLQIVAYESIRTAVRPNATPSDVQARANQVITERSINDASITVTPANVDALEPGTQITIVATATTGTNAVLPLQFFGGSLSARVVMLKE